MHAWPVRILRDPDVPAATYLAAAWFAASVPALMITYLLTLVLPEDMLAAVDDAVLPDPGTLWLELPVIVVAAPLLETLAMAGIFVGLAFLRVPAWGQVLAQAVIWGALHGSVALAWAFAPAWLFAIFAVVYLVQRRRSEARAFTMTAAVHALNNGLATAPLLLTGRA
mgnify:CR=1 FL=1